MSTLNALWLPGFSPDIAAALPWAALALFVIAAYRALSVPADIRHLPRVPILPLLWSYLTVEIEDRRFERLILPFAERGEGVVVVWALGRWMIHILDPKVSSELCIPLNFD